MILSFPFFTWLYFVIYDFWTKSLVSNIIYKNSRICSCFPERFYWLHNWASSSKNSKAFSISTAALQFRCKPAFFACNLHSFAIFRIVFFVCYFLSWIMSRSLTSQIITITTKSDNVIVEDWSRFIYFFHERSVEQKGDSWVFLPTSWVFWPLSKRFTTE